MNMSGIYICFEMRRKEIGIFVEGIFLGWLSRAWIPYIDLLLISVSYCHTVELVDKDISLVCQLDAQLLYYPLGPVRPVY